MARKDVPTCHLDERLGDVSHRVRDGGWNTCVVVNGERIVFGLLRTKELDGDPDRRVEEVMRPGPSTFRPYVSATEMARYMQEHDLESSPITRSSGELIGMLVREDAERATKQRNEHAHGE